jgi:hypothetical protein
MRHCLLTKIHKADKERIFKKNDLKRRAEQKIIQFYLNFPYFQSPNLKLNAL